MARIRTVKPEFFTHYGLYELEQDTGLPIRVAFAGLWTVCDREGRFKWVPPELKIACLPYDDIDFSRVLDALITRGFVVKYTCGTRVFGCVPGFKNHQVINNRESESVLPDPKSPDCEITNKNNVLTRDLRVNDACTTREVHAQAEGKGREGKDIKKSTPDGVPKEIPATPEPPPPKPKGKAKPKTEPRTKTVTRAEMRKKYPDLRDQTIDDWLAVRKAKRAPLTPTAWEACVREIDKSGLTGDQAIKIAAIRGWQGIKAEWLQNHIAGGQTHGPQGSQANHHSVDQRQDNSLAARVRRGSEQRLRDMGCSEDEIRGLVGSND